MTTRVAAADAMYSLFLDNFTGFPTDKSRVECDNEAFTPPAGLPWARMAKRSNFSGQETLGGAGQRKFDRGGSLFVQFFAPLNSGSRELRGFADEAAKLFEGVSLSGNTIRFNSAEVREIGPSDGWYMIVMEAVFVYTETR
jgi:hypothetical protein